MRQIAKYLLVVVVLALVIGAVALALLVPVKSTSEVVELQYKVSAVRVNWYLAVNGVCHFHKLLILLWL